MSRKAPFTVVALVALAVVVVAHRSGAATPGGDDKDVAAVRVVIEAQAAAWNRGDIAGYMEGYAREAATTFVSGDTVTRGWQTVMDRYKRNYDTREKMGTLAFTELEFKPLSDTYILAGGRWELTRASDKPHGRFTLIFQRTAAGWRIIRDHTSSAS